MSDDESLMSVRVRIVKCEERLCWLKAEIQRLRTKCDKIYNAAHKRVKSKVDGRGWTHIEHGLRNGTNKDYNWATNEYDNNVGWVVNHAGLKIVRGSIHEDPDDEVIQIDDSGNFFGGEED